MSVAVTRPLALNPLIIRRRRRCPRCAMSFQTEESPRLSVSRDGRLEAFQGAILLDSLRRSAESCGASVSDRRLHAVHATVISQSLQDGRVEQSCSELRSRVARTLLDQGLDQLAFRYDPRVDPAALLVVKRGSRPGEPFDPEKLVRSISAAVAKFLDREAIIEMVTEIEAELGASSGPLTTEEIRARVGEALRRRELRAYLRYSLGGAGEGESLGAVLSRVAPTAQVRKRSGAVVLFNAAKLGNSIRRSFPDELREAHDPDIAEFVAEEERRIRELAGEHGAKRTSAIGQQVLAWLFEQDERAWANYWLAFNADHESGDPVRQLYEARARLQRKSEES
jgi:transcriptional regulator NrdR family protein